DPTPSSISLEKIATLVGPGPLAAEITTFDDVSKRLFVASATFRTVDVFDMKDPAAPEKIGTINLSAFGSSVNSVDADNGVVAMAVQGPLKTDPGTNALAIVDIRSATVRQVIPLGYKDHRVVPLDASDRDGPGNGPLINIRTWPVPLFRMYQTDGIAS